MTSIIHAGRRTNLWFPYHGLVWGDSICLPTYHRRTEQHTYTLLYDPTPLDQGGYRVGARFGAEEVRHMLHHNGGALPTGAILEHCGKRYQVAVKLIYRGTKQKQCLIPIQD